MTDKNSEHKYQQELQGCDAPAMLAWALKTFGESKVLLASSLGAEDQVLTDMFLQLAPQGRVFTLDTGRLFSESYDVMQATMEHYANRYGAMRYEVCFPEAQDVVDLVKEEGPNLFYRSVDNRKKCCFVRKVKPLQKILATADLWITGLRRDQAVTRGHLPYVEWDEANAIWKLNPLADWSQEQVWDYIKKYDVPVNALHDRGFLSIGCAPCTRAIKSGEDIRAGRWWWETPEQKECGLHLGKDGKWERKKQ